MILGVCRCREPEGVKEAKMCEVIATYLLQINEERAGARYLPTELAGYIKRLVSHLEEHDYELLFDINDIRLLIYCSTDVHTPLYRITWDW